MKNIEDDITDLSNNRIKNNEDDITNNHHTDKQKG